MISVYPTLTTCLQQGFRPAPGGLEESATQRHKQCGIKLRPKKYEVFKREVFYVDRIISEQGYSMNTK